MKTGTENVDWRARGRLKRARRGAQRARGYAQLFEFREFARGKRLAGRTLNEGHARARKNTQRHRNRPARPEDAGDHAHTEFSTYGRGAGFAPGHGAKSAIRVPQSAIVRYATAFPEDLMEAS